MTNQQTPLSLSYNSQQPGGSRDFFTNLNFKKMSTIQSLLIENSNRPEIQEQIRNAATKGASDAGFNLIIGYDNQAKAGTKETYERFEEAIAAAMECVMETVDLG